MGPKKELKKNVLKNESGAKIYSIDDPINTESWKCVVVMAVERTYSDSFVLKEFMKESLSRRRQEVSLIDFDTMVMEIISYFANGELPYKYAFLMNFSSVFQEAVNYTSQKVELPIFVLVKIVKALLFYLREESLMKIKKAEAGLPDPIKAMTERPSNFEPVESKKKEISKKGDRLILRPPSPTKEDTELLKRGEGAKHDQLIDDAPQNAYFNLYVLLTGFYKPDFPLELIKAGIPLHSLICIDTSFLNLKQSSSSSITRSQKKDSETRSQEIDNFWKIFLTMIWDPEVTFFFKNTIFQVYMPQKFLCNKKKLREFIYREISYLMYDISDLKWQLNNYLDHMKLWNVTSSELRLFEIPLEMENLPSECISVPIVLQYVIDAVSDAGREFQRSLSSGNGSMKIAQLEFLSPMTEAKPGACSEERSWSQELEEKGDMHLVITYLKTKELDVKYELRDESASVEDSVKAYTDTDSQMTCDFRPRVFSENIEEAILGLNGSFGSYWKKYQKYVKTTYTVDYCLYALLMTKVSCSYEAKDENLSPKSYSGVSKVSDFEVIEKINEEMGKPRFTVTEGSRSVLRSAPFNVKNISRNFFCPEQLKIVSSEKLKASSAPEFRFIPKLKVQTLFTSEIFSGEILKNPFERLRGFVDECTFSDANGFDFVEFLSKPKLLDKEQDHWGRYNCVDHAYFFLDDSMFLVLHNRKDSDNVHHETFNETLKTGVGLRDFYDYVMEDEVDWLKIQDELHKISVFLANKVLENDSFRNFSDSEFWLVESLKYQYLERANKETDTNEEVKIEHSSMEKLVNKIRLKNIKKMLRDVVFEGYDVGEMAVQFSGLKTVYYANDCNITVQLIERLYGNQDLGVHVTTGSHTLHLYSYVCPKPHILDPFTFHVSYKNGIIIAFSRRFVKTTEETNEAVESQITFRGKKSSSESPDLENKKNVSRIAKDDEFLYDMSGSLPNGLFIQTIRRVVKPCYIKQQYLAKTEEIAKLEYSRLFLPNGNVVKMMTDGTVEILKTDSSITMANLSDLIYDSESGNLNLRRCEIVSGEGYDRVFEDGKMTSSERLHIFQNTDLETKQVYFRRSDGTNYMLQDDGIFCVQFNDGTRMACSVLQQENVEENFSFALDEEISQKNFSFPLDDEVSQEVELENDFVFVHLEITAEHPDYATTIYNTLTQKWKILLPYNSKITVEADGCYLADIDKQTEVKVETDLIEMSRFSSDGQLQSTFTADLSVFDNAENTTYCRVKDSTGKTFIVEGNSNCYVVNEKEESFQEESCEEVQLQESEQSELVSFKDLQTSSSIEANKISSKLFRDNKYFVIKRDLTGVELLHKDDVNKELSEKERESLIFTLNIPDTENRCFVLITPKEKKKTKKWEMETILPDPKYHPNASPKATSSTYGIPPSWMHPFPKKKTRFIVPQPLSCRVFVETKKTDLCPKVGDINIHNCEVEEVNQVKYSQITNGVEEFFKKLSNDDQDMLREMYILAVSSLINEKKKLKPVNSEKLEHYLEMSRYCVEMREYHKKCIRYHIVPNYFHHPAGMSWLILNDLLLKMEFLDMQTEIQTTKEKIVDSDQPLPPPKPSEGDISAFSNEEIEYNLSLSAGQSFSDLSFRSYLSAQTAPAVLKTGGVCRCKVKAAKDNSSPVIKFYSREQTFSDESYEEPPIQICGFQDKDIEKIEKKNYRGRKTLRVSLEDLMHLGLI